MRTLVLSVGILGLAVFAFAQTESSVVTTQAATAVTVVEEDVLGLEDAYDFEADFSGVGRIDILNNGLIIVKIPEVVYWDENDELQATPKEVVAFETAQAFPHDGNLQAIMSYEDAAFDFVFDGEGGALLTITSSTGLISQLAVFPAAAGAVGPTCSVTCGVGGDSSCTQTCPVGKACIAYCQGGVANCDCIAEPRPKKDEVMLMDGEMQVAE